MIGQVAASGDDMSDIHFADDTLLWLSALLFTENVRVLDENQRHAAELDASEAFACDARMRLNFLVQSASQHGFLHGSSVKTEVIVR